MQIPTTTYLYTFSIIECTTNLWLSFAYIWGHYKIPFHRPHFVLLKPLRRASTAYLCISHFPTMAYFKKNISPKVVQRFSRNYTFILNTLDSKTPFLRICPTVLNFVKS